MAKRNTTTILQLLRNAMKSASYASDPLQAYIIPTGDAHQSEYVAACHERRAFVTGFTGSAGTAVVTENCAALWTDGRYHFQAEKQLDDNWTLMKEGMTGVPTISEWLEKILPVASRIGVDPTLFAVERWNPLAKELKAVGHVLVPVSQNLVDLVWQDRPEPPCKPLVVLSEKYTGASWQSKIKAIRQKISENKAVAFVISALDEIAWLFNLRGSDICYNPVFFAFAVVTMDSVNLFIDQVRVDHTVSQHLELNGTGSSDSVTVEIRPYEEIYTFVSCLAETSDSKIWISPKSSFALFQLVPKTKVVLKPSPVAALKAIKNETEIAGMKQAQVRDAVALCEFFHWLEKEVPKGYVTEVSAATKLENFRRQQEDFISLSFDTISSSGPHGAVIHYKPSEASDVPITTDQIYLCDSGAQYRDGTTDTTRTIHLGTPSKFEQECFTRVLKGHIKLGTTVFPNGVTGHQLDVLARTALWDAGLEYLHGTGHGVGTFLNVHEGPCAISPRVTASVVLEAGMILSDEPGYYEDEKFGVRIESLFLIKKAVTPYNFKNKGFLTFEFLTPVPIQTKMIDPSLLTKQELDWINSFHGWCRELVGAELKRQEKLEVLEWLNRETATLG